MPRWQERGTPRPRAEMKGIKIVKIAVKIITYPSVKIADTLGPKPKGK